MKLPEPPPRIADLPKDRNGYPVPWFVAWVDGEPDFRVVEAHRIEQAMSGMKCWTCGKLLLGAATFVIGPMCAVNHVSSEPPSHRSCAQYAARACPFLTNPAKRRRKMNLPEGHHDAAGEMIERNPGVTLLWTSGNWFLRRVYNGVLFDIGRAIDVAWYCEGREATRAEVLHSIETGLPVLIDAAREDGDSALQLLDRRVQQAMELVPA